jgi:hypothetical protein
MENKGVIEIRIQGKKGNIELSPKSFDISEIRDLLENAEKLLFPTERKGRPLIAYEIAEGSVRHLLKTSLQAVIGFNALLWQVSEKGTIDFLENQTAGAFEIFQEIAQKQNYSFDISTSIENSVHLKIDSSTHFIRTETEWVDAEFYFYGDVVDMGGKNRANIHISAPGLGTYVIEAPKEFLKEYEKNPLYKPIGIRATGKQKTTTGEINKSSLRFAGFVEYEPKNDDAYLATLIKKAKSSWSDVADVGAWLRNLRGATY